MQKFISEYNYSINLPRNWSEYELDEYEKNTNGFFNIKEWSGNLRITPLNIKIENYEQFINKEFTEKNIDRIKWNNIIGIFYSENSDDLYIYYWYLIEQNNIYICSFTINLKNKDNEKNKKELRIVEKILKSLKTEY
jgi:hypothetical protein